MNLSEAKAKIGAKHTTENNVVSIGVLQLNTAVNEAGEKTEWLRHWDNENRIAVSLHKDLFEELKKDPKAGPLGLQYEVRKGEKGEYHSYRLVKYTPAEFTL